MLEHLDVIQWNVACLNSDQCAECQHLLNVTKANVLCVQEARPTSKAVLEFPGYYMYHHACVRGRQLGSRVTSGSVIVLVRGSIHQHLISVDDASLSSQDVISKWLVGCGASHLTFSIHNLYTFHRSEPFNWTAISNSLTLLYFYLTSVFSSLATSTSTTYAIWGDKHKEDALGARLEDWATSVIPTVRFV